MTGTAAACRPHAGYAALIAALASALALSLVCSAGIGVAGIPGSDPVMRRIVFEMRLPRAFSACLTGAAFALAGALMQGLTGNPLADSGLLGINAGAALFVTLGTALRPSMTSLGTMAFAFSGGALAAALVYGLGAGRKPAAHIRLILAGSAVAAMLTALGQGAALAFGLSKDLSFWNSGSLSGISWARLGAASPWIIAALGAAILLSGRLSVLALGEENAAGLGLNIRAFRLTGLAVALVLAGAGVSLAGGVSFLGLIVPHTARAFAGPDYRRIMPVAALLGGLVLVLSDLAARMINAPFDTPVGALVSLIGVPVFFAMTCRGKGSGS
ncbi:MAG: iron ABC transporter permease [Treponema sp.]|jgi:iron complex transport system permease protein|nr:iron ABC transporter permease [Treponema sp.]